VRQFGHTRRRNSFAHHQPVARIGAFEHRTQRKARIAQRFDILERMNGDIDHPGIERRIELTRPQLLTAHLGERTVLDTVAGGGHRHNLERFGSKAMRYDQRRNGHLRLRHRQRRCAGADTQRLFDCW